MCVFVRVSMCDMSALCADLHSILVYPFTCGHIRRGPWVVCALGEVLRTPISTTTGVWRFNIATILRRRAVGGMESETSISFRGGLRGLRMCDFFFLFVLLWLFYSLLHFVVGSVG